MSPRPESRPAASALAGFRRIAHGSAGRCRDVVSRHWLFLVIAACGTALRAVVQLAYQPALIFPDSERYLQYARFFIDGQWTPDWLRTSGYSLLLIPAVLAHNLAVVALVQHLMGLASAVLIYATGIHFGARRWLAAVATVPVLFDSLQLDIEQYVLTDVSATFLLVVALVVLVWKREAIGKGALVGAGLLIAAATLIRESDALVMFPVLVYLVATFRPSRRLAARALLLLFAGFAPPVLAYLGWFQASYDTFNFVTYNSQFMYGRIAQFAECSGMSLPSYERHLCIQQPPAQRDPNFYMWDKLSPQVTLLPADGLSRGQIIDNFDWRIIEHQPLTFLKVVAGDILYSFSPVRGDGPEHYPIAYHQFRTFFPGDGDELATVPAYTGQRPHVVPALASFLAGYGRYGYTPGPLLAAGLALGVVGMAGIGRTRRSGLRAPCMLFTIGTIAAVEPPFLITTFDWRYELPQLSLIPIAAMLALTALAGWARAPGRPAGAGEAGPDEGPQPLDQAVDLQSAIPGRSAGAPGTAVGGHPHGDDAVDVSG
ncbi:MAG TPA: hypothetical protein VHO07_04070 [Streptosporangiaceae bacterium]|jgi:hypothetical protein|nr:hypothetical protein [Streptosporangiaceae bacterium]